jgi:hypothetical protein
VGNPSPKDQSSFPGHDLRMTKFSLRRFRPLLPTLIALLLGLLIPGTGSLQSLRHAPVLDTPVADAYSGRARHIGYGISVAPFVPSQPGMLDTMGMDWVKVYDTSQIADYPNQYILYRVDVPKNPNEYDGWERGLGNLARELTTRGVDAVEIGNELNLHIEWAGGLIPDAKLAADSLCRGYRQFKAAAPEIIVVAGGLAPTITTPDRRAQTDLTFAQEMFNHGAGACFDAYGYHPYGFNQPPEADPNRHELVFRRTERMYRLLWDNGIRDKQVWITEFGWVRNPAEDHLNCASDPQFVDFAWMIVDKNTQADYISRAWDFADRNWPWVGPMFLWNLNWNLSPDQGLSACSHMRRFAILDNQGQPLPAFYSVQNIGKRPPIEYRPRVGSIINGGMSKTMEAGCTGETKLGSFTVLNSGFPGHLDVEIEAANGPGRPRLWTSTNQAESRTEVDVFADASGLGPGLHMVAINLRAYGSVRMSTDVVRGWLLIHYPTTPACVARFNNGQ